MAFPELVSPSNEGEGNGTAAGPLPTTAPFMYITTVFTASVAERVMAMCVHAPYGIGAIVCSSLVVVFGRVNLRGTGLRVSSCRSHTQRHEKHIKDEHIARIARAHQ
jgi:hypothetical protein